MSTSSRMMDLMEWEKWDHPFASAGRGMWITENLKVQVCHNLVHPICLITYSLGLYGSNQSAQCSIALGSRVVFSSRSDPKFDLLPLCLTELMWWRLVLFMEMWLDVVDCWLSVVRLIAWASRCSGPQIEESFKLLERIVWEEAHFQDDCFCQLQLHVPVYNNLFIKQ